MPVQVSYPGVYIEELPSSGHDVTPAPTGVAAFIGRAARGPVDVAVNLRSFHEFESVFGGLWLDSSLGYAVRDYFLQGGTEAVVVRVHEASPDDTAVLELGAGASMITLSAASPGAWGAQLVATLELSAAPPTDAGPRIDLSVQDTATGAVERHTDVRLDPTDPRRLDLVLEHASELVRVRGPLPTVPPTTFPVSGVAAGGGDGGALTAASFRSDPAGRADGRGLYALDEVAALDLLVVPPYLAPGPCLPVTEGGVDASLVADLVGYAEERDAMVLLDPPPHWHTVADAVAGAEDLTTSSHAAVYFPRLRQPDPLRGDAIGTFPPAGAIAGVIARTDVGHGVWVSPAGLRATLDGVDSLELHLSDSDVGTLNVLAVNCLVRRPGAGPAVWGARTRAGGAEGADEFRYVPVRRLVSHVTRSLATALTWTAFEPNDEALWSQVRTAAATYLHGLFVQGALAGTKPSDAYSVRCDVSTTSTVDVAEGVANLLVGVAPVRPAEFIVLRIRLTAGS